ncbi:MAG TPA: chemotaxis protein CheW [Magnetospirillaceae bacterium]|nr:chemotaxis protein CheW [Magnetospirillaceae bacterium]
METLKIVTLGLREEIFAVDAGIVREILDMVPVTAVPNADPFVNGLINVRGRVVPLADLHVRFGMETPPASIDTRIVVVDVELGGEPTTIGILADKVYEVTEVTSRSVQEAPRLGMRWRPEFIQGISKRGDDFMAIIDLSRLLNHSGPLDEAGAGDGRSAR